ncbi:S41 family peptidase [Desulfocurvibacter africanus]|uniref:S41 family peptidase n=1 Tax=Desulfocurvibacter africanus TaxID=873 RepID=UPI000481DC45|nr:S41 family peptidase [Desulfocurvibacter africanus]
MRGLRLFACLALLMSLTIFCGDTMAVEQSDYMPFKRFSQILDLVEQHYVLDISRKELIDDAIKGMLQQLDPHSAYMDSEEFKEMRENTMGEFPGIGVEIGMDNSRLIVVSPIEDTPAYKAGLRSGDLILEIDGVSTQDMSMIDAVKRIRGPEGTPVVLTILHAESQAPERVTIVRGIIPLLSVKGQLFDGGVLLARVTRFHEDTTNELVKAIKDASKTGPIKGIVLDLRNNPGGLLDQAVSLSDLFIKEGLVTYIQGKNKADRRDFSATSKSSDLTVPMVVLINAGSASASEIVAGALQDHRRALIVGEQSFGKGSVQTVIGPLPDGSGIKLTTALYYTPKGRSIQAEGIVPDLIIPFQPITDKADAPDRFTLRERDLSRHLANGNGSKAPKTTEQKAVELLANDNQLRMAVELVKGLPAIRQLQHQ